MATASLFPRIGHLWEDICGYIIRPQRAEYDPEELGPEVFRLSKEDKRQFRREDIILENMRGYTIRCTWFAPNHKPTAANPNPTPIPVVVYLHGNCGCRCDALEVLHLLSRGFSLFCYDACGSGMSDGDYVSLGFYERQDLATVIEYINESRRATSIGLWGRSMGAVTAIMYAARDPSIRALVLDSPFSQLRRLIHDLVRAHASFMPESWTGMAVRKIRKKIAKLAQFDIDDLDAVKYGMQCAVPTFIFHGRDDDFVAPYHSELIAEHFSGMCFHHRVEGGHNSFRKADVMGVAIPHLELYLIQKPEDERRRKEAAEALAAVVRAEAAAALEALEKSGHAKRLQRSSDDAAALLKAQQQQRKQGDGDDGGGYTYVHSRGPSSCTPPPLSPSAGAGAGTTGSTAGGGNGLSSVSSSFALSPSASSAIIGSAPSGPPRVPRSRPAKSGTATPSQPSLPPRVPSPPPSAIVGALSPTSLSSPTAPNPQDNPPSATTTASAAAAAAAPSASGEAAPVASVGEASAPTAGSPTPAADTMNTAAADATVSAESAKVAAAEAEVAAAGDSSSSLTSPPIVAVPLEGTVGASGFRTSVSLEGTATATSALVPPSASSGGSSPSPARAPSAAKEEGAAEAAVAAAAATGPLMPPSACRAEDEDTDDDEAFEKQYADMLLSVRNAD